MSVYTKLQSARVKLQNTNLSKSGKNTFAGYEYFELGDFLPQINLLFEDLKLFSSVSFTKDIATLKIIDTEDQSTITFESPMGSATLKGCQEVQNIGAVETFQRRYLYIMALEIVEHDALDATMGKEKETKKESSPQKPQDAPKPPGQKPVPIPPLNPVTIKISGVETLTGVKDGKAWTRYVITAGSYKFQTFSDTHAANAQKAREMDLFVMITFTTDAFGIKIKDLKLPEPEEPGSNG
jgi:hypothetical protein